MCNKNGCHIKNSPPYFKCMMKPAIIRKRVFVSVLINCGKNYIKTEKKVVHYSLLVLSYISDYFWQA